MKRILVAFIFIHACAVWAGEPAPSQPKPNSELKKQDFFVGNWTLTGETKPGGQKFQFTARFQWMPGELFLVSNWSSGGKWVELTVIGYDPNKRSSRVLASMPLEKPKCGKAQRTTIHGFGQRRKKWMASR